MQFNAIYVYGACGTVWYRCIQMYRIFCIVLLFMVFPLGFADLGLLYRWCVRADPPGCVFRVPDDDIYFNAPEEGLAALQCHKVKHVSNSVPAPPSLLRQQIHDCTTDWDDLGNTVCVLRAAPARIQHLLCKENMPSFSVRYCEARSTATDVWFVKTLSERKHRSFESYLVHPYT